jgi:hypothetical protein
MNIETAATEALVRFLDFETGFDRSFKLGIAALLHVEKVVSGVGGPRIIQGLIADTGEAWRIDDGWSDPPKHIRRTQVDASLLGLVQVHAAIDDFVVSLEADLARWNDAQGIEREKNEATEDDDESERFEVLCRRHGWKTRPLGAWTPLLQFFRMVRNCVAHRSGMATRALANAARAPELAECLAKWGRRVDSPPPMPEIAENSEIVIAPRHVILSLEAAQKASSYLNKCALDTFGDRGMVYLAAHHSLLTESPRVLSEAHTSPEAVVNFALSDRYKVRNVATKTTIEVLRDLGVWSRCRSRHSALYGSLAKPRKRRAR